MGDTARINEFIEMERGGIYTVAKDELKSAISFQVDKDSPGGITDREMGRHDDFCASLVMRFYQHMGWVEKSCRPCNSVMPSDFDVSSSSHRSVEIKNGMGWLSPPNLILCPKLGAKIPLKLPKLV